MGEALVVIVEREQSVVVIKLEELFIIAILVLLNLTLIFFVHLMCLIFVDIFTLRVNTLCLLIRLSIIFLNRLVVDYFFDRGGRHTCSWLILGFSSLNHGESLNSQDSEVTVHEVQALHGK